MIKVFSIFDVKADAYRNLFTMSTKAQAIRAFSDLAHDKSTDVGMHPEDYRLVALGDFDDSAGVLIPGKLESLGFAIEWVSPKKE